MGLGKKFLLFFILNLLALGCGCSSAPKTLINPLDHKAVEKTMLQSTSSYKLLQKGRELFQAKNYTAAKRRFEVLHLRDTTNYEALVWLGLSLWFQGKAEEMSSLWQGHKKHVTPSQEKLLTENASALLLLAYRLGAKRTLAEHSGGILTPTHDNTIVILPIQPVFSIDEAKSRTNLEQALALLFTIQIEKKGLTPAPRQMLQSLLNEANTAPESINNETALNTAQILGAEYALTLSTWYTLSPQKTLHTKLSLLPAASTTLHKQRLNKSSTMQEKELQKKQIELANINTQLAQIEAILDYQNHTTQITRVLEKRSKQLETVRKMQITGKSTEAIQAMKDYENTQKKLTALQKQTKEFERKNSLHLPGMFKADNKYLQKQKQTLAKDYEKIQQEKTDMERLLKLTKNLAHKKWDKNILHEAEFVTALPDLSCWASEAHYQLFLLSQPPLNEKQTCPASPRPLTPEDIHPLQQALVAWDNGEYNLAKELFSKTSLPHTTAFQYPGPDFDLLHLMGLSSEDIARFFIKRLLPSLPGQ